MIKNSELKKQSIYGAPFQYSVELKIWKSLPDVILFSIFLLYVLLAVSFLSVYSYYTVQHTSMQPLLNNYTQTELMQGISDGVYINLKAQATVGDVIVIKNEFDLNVESIVKRLIAEGGDKIAIKKVFLPNDDVQYNIMRIVKGNEIPYVITENYLDQQRKTTGMEVVYNNFYSYLSTETNKETINGVTYLVLEDDEIFYLGDNRGNSRDCSEYGPAKKESIIGRVDVIVPRQQNMIFHIFEYLLGFKNV